METKILPFSDEHSEYVRTLNEEWLNRYFRLEGSDKRQLSNPRASIIEPGGRIFMAECEGQICGVVALMRVSDGVYELSKMAVTERFQGKGIGRKLANACIDCARAMDARSLILYSNRSLESAIHLYESLGFREIPLVDVTYERADIKMQLDLT
jgi:ribosomal protein S18 acetylase RimI-like enzyme